MSEAKFTKGEWVIYDGEVRFCKGKVCVIEDDGLPTVICDTNDFFGNEEKAANAHLIAVAPKMYDKLDELYVRICLNGGKADFDEGDAEEIKELLAEARGEQ